MALVRFDGSDTPDRLPLPARRHLQTWYHLFPAGAEVPAIGREAGLAEIARILMHNNAELNHQSGIYLRVTLRRLDGRRETITFTEGQT